jgi:hypothetical protein
MSTGVMFALAICKVVLKIITSTWQFRNIAPSSASTADATTNLNIEHSV